MRYWVISLCLMCLSTPSYAGELTGYIGVDSRVFFQGAEHDGQNSGNIPSVVMEPEYYHVSDDEVNTFTFRPFARLDANDSKRSHLDIRQLDWLHARDSWEVRAGISKVYWGVAESNHLVDIINQTDAIESTDGEDKLGQPMLQFGWFQPWGNLRFFYLPYFRERTLTGRDSRLRGETPIESSRVEYASSQEEWHPDVAIRYTHTLGDWDIGLAHFSGTSREAVFKKVSNDDGQDVFIPRYELIDQTSLDLQFTRDAWLWKFEGITTEGVEGRFSAFVGGFEYSFFGVFETDYDLGLLLEYSRDDRGQDEPGTFLDDDIFMGARFVLNDEDSTEFLIGAIRDRRTNVQNYSMEASKRFGERWKGELELRIFDGSDKNEPEYGLRRDSFLGINLFRYF